MNEPKDFTLDEVPQPTVSAPSSVQAVEVHETSAFGAQEVNDAGRQLAAELEARGYHPVVIFGNAASGKTSLLLSLLAVIKTEASLETGLTLGEPILNTSSPYGKYIQTHSDQFFGRKTQEFIEGVASPKTNIDYPFIIPVVFRPRGKPEAKFAFLESNGEWYRPDRESDALFQPLRKQIEDLIREFQLGISFVHLVPYTQGVIRSTSVNITEDISELQEASLAIAGALNAYEKIRIEKSRDRHVMLVTKWDAHTSPQSSVLDVLIDTADDVEPFVEQHYSQAFSSFKGLTVNRSQVFLANYCAGLISNRDVLSLRIDSELRPAVLRFPVSLWGWLYRNAIVDSGGMADDPFPQQNSGTPKILQYLWALLDRFF